MAFNDPESRLHPHTWTVEEDERKYLRTLSRKRIARYFATVKKNRVTDFHGFVASPNFFAHLEALCAEVIEEKRIAAEDAA